MPAGDLLSLILYLLDMSVGNTVPGTASAALPFLEAAGGVADNGRISHDPSWENAVEYADRRLSLDQSAVNRAPPFTIITIVALELIVVSERPLYNMFCAGLRLLKI